MSDFGNTGPYYNGGGSGGGGGYLPSGSQDSGGEEIQMMQKHGYSLRPVTIMQIHDAVQSHADAEFSFEGVEPTQIVIVAMVLSSIIQTTHHVYTVYDGTGRIEARRWIESNEDRDPLNPSIEDNSWVRIIGHVKSFNNKRTINALVVIPIAKDIHDPSKDMNEVYYHHIDALYTHLYSKYGPSPSMLGPGASAAAGDKTSTARGVPSQYSAAANPSSSLSGDFYKDFSDAGRLVHLWMKANAANASEDGISFLDIAKGIRGQLPTQGSTDVAQQISEAIDWLTENGHIYATTDENHYALA
ncbi:uncharacterized protein EI90DRAFT_1533383 [Cantharellus anzutake]|uniref:uncharacterized protein n=1 Tax=Cantharellus anzutake TaxID=1750568 RepID=UPI001908222C|nr:uncharacterized protein EI90DRAFT_1533383 [Cantharellus anzutake]KAF8328540.1 hypothetical protein EI90DRAFT_1533383 [Cantharellus anzutake]